MSRRMPSVGVCLPFMSRLDGAGAAGGEDGRGEVPLSPRVRAHAVNMPPGALALLTWPRCAPQASPSHPGPPGRGSPPLEREVGSGPSGRRTVGHTRDSGFFFGAGLPLMCFLIIWSQPGFVALRAACWLTAQCDIIDLLAQVVPVAVTGALSVVSCDKTVSITQLIIS